MFKDYDKYLSASLKVYLFLLIVIFIMKIVGLDYFGLDVNNPTLIKISDLLSKNHLGDIYNFFTLYISSYLLLCLSTNKRRLFKETLISTLIVFIPQCLLFVFYKIDWIYPILCFVTFLIAPMVVNKKVYFKEPIKYIILMNLYQFISLFVRNIGVNANYGNFLIDSILNIDQLLLFAITYNIHFMKGDEIICGVEQVVYSSSQMKQNFLSSLKDLQRNYSNLDRTEKATFIIYSTLSLIWNLFTIITVLFIAKLNDTVIECIFILTSFWISKRIFGKAFHLKSMILCFVLSNVSYYVLNRITTPIGISILIPIMLGVGLSYVTSKFVKSYKPLYRGMPVEEFDDTILRLVDKGSDKYNICYDFFIKKENAVLLGRKYNYTEAGIRKITSRINNSIKALK